jgi:hypothetical protein
MSAEFHPSQYDSLSNAHRAAQLQSWTCAIAAMLLIGATAATNNQSVKLLTSAGTLAACAIAQPSRRTCRKLKGLIRDGEDISAAAYQQYLWEAFKPRQVIEAQIIEPEPEIPLLPVDSLIGYPSILIHGAQGSGKTSLAAYILQRRREVGHAVTVLDPHAGFGQWEGLRVVGAGMDFGAIDEEIDGFIGSVKDSYSQHRAKPTQFAPATLFVDEFTNLASRAKNAGELFKSGVSDLRKINKHLLIVSHARTLAGLGDARGMAKTRDNGLLEIFLDVDLDVASGSAKPALSGTIKYPGKDPMPIRLAPWMRGSMTFTQPALPEQGRPLAEMALQDLIPESTAPTTPQDKLEAIFSQDVVSDEMPKDELLDELTDASSVDEMPEDCRQILLFARDRDWFTTKELKAGKKSLRNISSAQLNQLLDLLEQAGWLEGQPIRNTRQYRLIPGFSDWVDLWRSNG